jgi:phosphate-selective porin
MRLCLFFLLTIPLTVGAQPLRKAPTEASSPAAAGQPSPTLLIFRDASGREEVLPDVQAVARRLHREMRRITQSSLSAAEKQQALERALIDNDHVFSALGQPQPTSIDAAIDRLELMFFEQAIVVSPDDATREAVLADAPAHLDLDEPLRPILIARKKYRQDIVITRDAEAAGIAPWWREARVDTEALELSELEESPEPAAESEKKDKAEEPVKVEFLADEAVTVEMHDDTTVLRDVEGDDGDLVLFDALHVWIGGAVQLDAYLYDDLFSARDGGESMDDTFVRRGEVVVRSTLFDWGEVKAQYDLDSDAWRDLYYRNVNEDESRTFTIGNQKEPMGLDYLMGNKFGTAMERSAVSTAFASFRGAGVRVNRWFDLAPEQQYLRFGGDKHAYITTTLGLFGQDIENSSTTDVALTGRVTAGRSQDKGLGMHVGGSLSLREGDYTRIAPRPGMHDVDRIPLAFFDADQQAVVALEGMATRGSLHVQAEFYYSDYSGGNIDGDGYGAYVQAGWFITGEQRTYRPKWGLWAPVAHSDKGIFEVFARAGYTYGDSDQSSSNNLQLFTVGGSWYWRKFRASINGLYSKVDRDINDEDSGFATTVRFQYLF